MSCIDSSTAARALIRGRNYYAPRFALSRMKRGKRWGLSSHPDDLRCVNSSGWPQQVLSSFRHCQHGPQSPSAWLDFAALPNVWHRGRVPFDGFT
jgi:hypothetical protein